MIYKKPEEIKLTFPKVNNDSYLRYFESSSKIDRRFDQLIPRNDIANPEIIIEKGEYLSRISSLKRKYLGVQYRYECWGKVMEAHKNVFQESVRNWKSYKGDDQELQESKYSSRISLSRGFTLSGVLTSMMWLFKHGFWRMHFPSSRFLHVSCWRTNPH